MRRIELAAIGMIATILVAYSPARAQLPRPSPTIPVTTRPLTPLAWYGIGSIACAAVSPMIGTLVLGRELTVTEVDRMALSCFLGPVGWLLGPVLFPDPVVTLNPPPGNPPPHGPRGPCGLRRGR